MATTKKSDTPIQPYNPFFIALNGITSLFSNALSVGIVILLISAVGSITSVMVRDDGKNEPNLGHQLASLSASQLFLLVGMFAVILIFTLVVSAMLHGIQSYTALRLARGEKTTIGEAFNTVLGQFGGYLILYIWMNVKIFLWSLLLIVPGVIAYYRYSFAGMVFFDKNLHHEQAIKESNRLTKDGIMTLLASHWLFSMLTLGYISSIVSLASTSELYREYTTLDKAKRDKPAIHWLSWLTLALPFIFFIGALLFILVLVLVIGVTGGVLTR